MSGPLQRLLVHGVGILMLAVAAVHPATADDTQPRVHVVSIGLWGYQNLFKREAIAAADVISARYGRSGQMIVRTNSLSRSAGRISDVRDTLQGLASTMDRQEDILFLFLTSHGNAAGLAVITNDAKRPAMLSPGRLSGILAATGIRYRVVIISACYSGVFADQIADDNTLVITAADAQHSSFGCGADNIGNWTYFGQAFFADSLARGLTLDAAFQNAKVRIGEREQAEKLVGSNPQIKGGDAVHAQLARMDKK